MQVGHSQTRLLPFQYIISNFHFENWPIQIQSIFKGQTSNWSRPTSSIYQNVCTDIHVGVYVRRRDGVAG